ncbi:MAG: hypothetical protein K8R88_05030 [Armatimonadetes bacterium]|nr:hypothetical protein [Armatimonadota bacterium]
MFDAIAVYSWPENYQAFRARAATELHAKGFVREVANGKTYSWENWERKDGCSVMLQPAEKLGVSALDDSRETPAFRDDPSWVSVIVFGDAPDTPLNHLRYGLQ